MNFVVVRSPSSYNEIIGRLGVRKLQAVPSTSHGMLKLPVEGGVITLKSSRMVPLECAMVFGPKGNLLATKQTVEERIKKPADMTGVPRHIAEHRLNVREGCSPVRQKKRGQAVDRNQEIQEEVRKLVEAGIMKEVHYQDWLSNPVMVKKHDDSWRMYVDFKDLNKACPKDSYPLPEIDWKMPSGLRNVRATYQRLVDKAFHKQIGRNLKVYVDDLVIKIHTEDEIVRDIEETGLKVCPDKVDAVLSLPSRKCLKDVQKLNGKLASLNRFLTKSAEKSLPFFKTLKKCTKKSDFHWTAEAEEAFKQIKQLIAELPMLATPMEKEELIVYLAAAKETVSAVLMTKRETKQMPIYFVSKALRGPEINYTSMEKLVLALVHAYGSEAGLILTNPEGMKFTYALRFRFEATNNEAEYEALIVGLRIAEQMGVKNLQSNVDSRLVANQVNGTHLAKEVDMIRYLEKGGNPASGCEKRKSSKTQVTAICQGPGKVKFLIVAIDYFTKWIEAKLVATITGNQIKKFMWDNIVCRFGLSGEIISDNGK
ncbi:reverse transcriptase domain-containing protein [Tanacetum coccineum]